MTAKPDTETRLAELASIAIPDFYTIERIDGDAGRLAHLLPNGLPNAMNFVLFSTSGVHGSYATIENIEASLKKYGTEPLPDDATEPDDYFDNKLTYLLIRPRIVHVTWGTIEVHLNHIHYLIRVRDMSHRVIAGIGL